MVLQSPLQRVQPVSGTAQMFEAICGRDVGKYQFYLLDMLRMNPTSIPSLEKALQSAMPEANDHGECRSDKYGLSIVTVWRCTASVHDCFGSISLALRKRPKCCRKFASPYGDSVISGNEFLPGPRKLKELDTQ